MDVRKNESFEPIRVCVICVSRIFKYIWMKCIYIKNTLVLNVVFSNHVFSYSLKKLCEISLYTQILIILFPTLWYIGI